MFIWEKMTLCTNQYFVVKAEFSKDEFHLESIDKKNY